ncbi:hypothetical protein CMO95_02090 [Candidatus Woesearchaeota archaeon]|jgi:hypothetical protein|nr:hypothetical protein [Candidatus Woesearchaeota archaeon]|tara:strand:+ start:165 stop:404 length:240 start_codon:yes stop_codon:yes gene_type:complete
MANLEEQEFEKLKQHEATKNAILFDIGAMATQTKKLHKAFENLENDMQTFREELVAKYGKINVDLKDGSYTVVEEENQE